MEAVPEEGSGVGGVAFFIRPGQLVEPGGDNAYQTYCRESALVS